MTFLFVRVGRLYSCLKMLKMDNYVTERIKFIL